MSYSKYERKKYIRLKMIHLLLLDGGAGKITTEQWGTTWDLIDEMGKAGTTHCQELARNEYYIKAVAEWVKAKEAHRQRIIESKSL